MSQTQRVLKLLQKGKKLTPLDALAAVGTFRLGARIHELRKQGYDIKTEMVERAGSRVARYSL